MAITTCIPDGYREEMMKGTHASGDTYKIALYTSSASLGKSTTAYSATNEVSGAGYSAGGATLGGYATSIDANVAILDFSDPSWAAATFTARGCMIYNSSKSNKVVSIHDFGADYTSSGGTFSITFPAAAAATGLVRFS